MNNELLEKKEYLESRFINLLKEISILEKEWKIEVLELLDQVYNINENTSTSIILELDNYLLKYAE